MRLHHPDRPGATVRLGYCLNVHAAEHLEGVLAGLEAVTAPVARAVGGEGPFGVGPWLAAGLARRLTEDGGERDRLASTLARLRLVPFTFNAFPYGGFHAPGLKAGVYRPTWRDPERAAFTRQVARLAAALTEVCAELGEPLPAHVSVSTHCGGFRTDVQGPEQTDEVARALAAAVADLSALERESGVRVVLSLEPEPRSSVNDTGHLAPLFAAVRGHVDADLARRHLGACLDACHAAVEFEEPSDALRGATAGGHPLGKLQFSSALGLDPSDDDARTRLFALDEPVYLHQVTGRGPDGFVRTDDLDAARRAWEGAEPGWRTAAELRCHFHVPVDLDRVGRGLRTTRPFADAVLSAALAAPDRWGSPELHVEVETYTWDVLPPEARGPGGLPAALTRELEHVLTQLATHGWQPA